MCTGIILFVIACNQQSDNEIDRLAEKYKGLKEINLKANTIVANVQIYKNNDSLPFEVCLSGETMDRKGLAEIVYNLVHEKLNSGYTFDSTKYYNNLDPTFHPIKGTQQEFNLIITSNLTIDYLNFIKDSITFECYLREGLFQMCSKDLKRAKFKVDI